MALNVGEVSVTLSMSVYLVWFVPQIWLNFKRKNTEGLSLGMHGILCLAYLSDLIYGFGLGMQWQYRVVTVSGLLSLAIQHYQFGRFGLHRRIQVLSYLVFSTLCIGLILVIFWLFVFKSYPRHFYDTVGMLSNILWLSYALPQIVKNFIWKSTVGLSPYFVVIALFLNLCDTTSAWALHWDYPSKVGVCIAWLEDSILLLQVIRYAK